MAKPEKVTSLTQLSLARIKKKVKMFAGGNSERTLRDLAVDIINESGESYQDIAEGTYLHPKTIQNLAEDKTTNPHHETLTRLFQYFNVKLTGTFENVKPLYRNKPKT